MKKILFLIALFAGFQSFNAQAAITVTAGTGGTNICANNAQTGSTPTFTTLSPIILTEGTNGDITNGFHGLVINAPAGWQFNTASVPTLTFTGADIIAVNSGGITATSFTINIINFGTANISTITITGLQVQATATGSAAGAIRASAAPGLTGITTGGAGTVFANLSLTPSLVPSVSIVAAPAGPICSGTNVTFTATPVNGGTPTYQWFVAGALVPGATNSTFSSNTLTAGNTVRVQMAATGCVNPANANSNIINMTVNPTPAAVTVSTAGTYCDNTTLTATGGGGITYFQGTVFNGVSVATPSTSQVITATGTYTYYFRTRSGAGCWGPQGAAKVTINPSPGAISVSPAATTAICFGDSATFSVSAASPLTEVLYEDFDAGLGGWSINNIAGVANSFWQVRNAPGWGAAIAGGGTPYMEAAPDATSGNTNTIVTSPSFSLTGYTSATLTFNQYFQSYVADATVAVEYSIDGGGSWVPFIDQLGTTVSVPSWVAATPTTSVALPGAVLNQPNVQLRWNYNSTWGWYWAIDNIAVKGTPTLTYDWVGVSGATGLSCTTCDTVTITPATAGVNVYSVSTTVGSCTTSTSITVTANPLPAAYTVTGGGAYCAGGTGVNVGLSGSDLGVDYQLYMGAATVGTPVAGTGLPLDFGLQTVAGSYSVVATTAILGCTSDMPDSAVISIDPLPSPITGLDQVCLGSTITLTDTTAGGTWSSSDVATAPVDAAGNVTGIILGIADITYTIPTGCFVTYSVTVNTLPVVAPITGITNLCVGGTTTLSSATPGGAWSSAGATTAAIDAVTGDVTAVSAGITTISYTVTSGIGCTTVVTTEDTVSSLPASAIMPAGTYVTLCGGNDAILVATLHAGFTYQWAMDGVDIAGATNNNYTATMPGTYTVTLDNGACTLTLTKIVLADPNAVISYNSTGNYLYTGSFTTYQWFLNGTVIAGATNSIYFSPTPGSYTVVVSNITGCMDTSAAYTFGMVGIGNNPTTAKDIKVYPNPASSVIYINAPVKVSVSVITPDGRLVIDNKDAVSINISGLANGVYMILVYDENKTLLKTERFSKID